MAVAGQEDTKVTLSEDIDIMNRDPEGINQHLKVTFEEVFAEPHPSIYSFDKIWTLSYAVFTASKLWCYRIITLICGIPCAFCWGLEFACISFCQIWYCVPCYKAFEVYLLMIRKYFNVCIEAFIQPMVIAASYLFSNIRVTNINQ